MRSILWALAAAAALAWPLRAAELRTFDDAPLRAVQFTDRDEGWAVGDEGVVWHTIDGGKTWERQPTGVRASLRSLHFLNPFTGWVAGREELPGSGSVGVLLFTQDGGLTWHRVDRNRLPGLNRVRFLDNRRGFVAGDGTEQFPSGVFATTDNGRTWQPVKGPRCPAWLAADFQDGPNGVLGGAWNRLMTLRDGNLAAADFDPLGGRSVTGVQLAGDRAVAVAQGGLVLLSNTGGRVWKYADLKLPAEARAGWDFHAVHCRGDDIWVVGRPGSAVLHSPDQGLNWEVLVTRQPLPLNGVFFADARRGWAVGEFGTILGTDDGGKSWTVQRRGGLRAAVLFVHARAAGLPAETVAMLGGQEGYLAVGVRVNGSDPGSADPALAGEELRFAAAVRRAGGAAGEMLWQFPLAQHQVRAAAPEVLQSWDRLHDDRAREEFLRQMVLVLRTWRPDVVVTDPAAAGGAAYPCEALLADVMRQAFTRAADASAFPEQIRTLGLEPWKVGKLYGRCEERIEAQVAMDAGDVCPRLQATAREFAAPAAGLLADATVVLPARRYYRLLESRLVGAARHRDLMQGVILAPGGVARRLLPPEGEPSAEVVQSIRTCRNLEALAEAPASPLNDAGKLLAQLAPALQGMPDERAAGMALAVGNQYRRLGQWTLAKEVFLFMVAHYPADPRTADAYRWLIRYGSSSEARRRQEMGQFVAVGRTEFRPSLAGPTALPGSGPQHAGATVRGASEMVREETLTLLANPQETRKWNEDCLALGARLAALGPLFADDPGIQFCLQAARRNLGDIDNEAQPWYTRFANEHPEGPWHDAAAAEVWLARRSGPPPKPVAVCRQTATPPVLDGKLDDSCWQGLKPMVLGNAAGTTGKDYPTEAWLAYDQQFLYLALRCRHPAGRQVPRVKVRPRDADLRPYDRVSLLLDLDRDYATCFHLQVDQRGCVCEDCWGDFSWNPRWFVAVQSEPTEWRIEAAIPLVELTGDPVTVGHAWACNVVRVLPGRGVQAWSLPADVQPRPEGMGLLFFAEALEEKKARAGAVNEK